MSEWTALKGARITWGTTKQILRKEKLKLSEFRKWFLVETGPIVEHEDGSVEVGVEGYDLLRFISKKKGEKE